MKFQTKLLKIVDRSLDEIIEADDKSIERKRSWIERRMGVEGDQAFFSVNEGWLILHTYIDDDR